MMFKLKVESVTLEIELARDKWVGCKQTQKCEKIKVDIRKIKIKIQLIKKVLHV